ELSPLSLHDALPISFSSHKGQSRILLRLDPAEYSLLEFALFYPKEGRWDNNGGRNYQIRIAQPERAGLRPAPALKAAVGEEQMRSEEHTSELQSRFD